MIARLFSSLGVGRWALHVRRFCSGITDLAIIAALYLAIIFLTVAIVGMVTIAVLKP